MPAAAQHRRTRTSRLARKLAVAGTGIAVLALPVIGATSASAATPTVTTATSLGYTNTLDGWIQASLQVIDPTFQAYHVSGTSWDPYDPVANITAACNYAAQRYGSIDNVWGAY